MKKCMLYVVCCLLIVVCCRISVAKAQEVDTISAFEINVDAYSYFFKDDYLFLPVIKADKDKLHIEIRYNYENTKTFSAWGGYNFSGEGNIEYTITPMAGIVFGDTRGIAPGLEATFTYKKIELYSEGEYVFDFDSKDYNFFYNWSDLSYAFKDWLWFGLSGQRLRSYNAALDFQRGILIGGGGEKWQANGYLFNIDTDDPFYVLGLSYRF